MVPHWESIQDQILDVSVIDARGLTATETGYGQYKYPYVVVKYGNTQYRTKFCTEWCYLLPSRGRYPIFRDKFTFKLIEGLRGLEISYHNSNSPFDEFIASEIPTETVSINLSGTSPSSRKKDDFIGEGKVALNDVLQTGCQDITCHLKNGSLPAGKINLKMMHTRTQASYKELRVAKEKAERDLMLYTQPALPRTQLEQAKVNELELMKMKKKLDEKDLEISALTEALNACSINNGLEQAVRGINFESALEKSRSELKDLKLEFHTYRKTAEQKAFQNDMKLESTLNTMQAELDAKDAELMTQTEEFNAFREVSQKNEVAARNRLEICEFALKQMREAKVSEDVKLAALREKLEATSCDVMTYQLAQKQLQSDLAGKDTELTDVREKLKASSRIAEKEDAATQRAQLFELALKQVRNENVQKDAKLAELFEQLRLRDSQTLQMKQKLKKFLSELTAEGNELRSLVTQHNECKSNAKQVANKTKSELDTKDAKLRTLKNNHDQHWKDAELHHESISKKQMKLKVMLAGMMYRMNGILELAKATINEDHRDGQLKAEVHEEVNEFYSLESEDVFENFSDEELEAMYQLVSSPDEDETKILSNIFKSIVMALRLIMARL